MMGEWLADCDPALRVDAVMVVSELVANAVRHGRAPIRLVAVLDGERLWLEVTDGGRAMPRPRDPGAGGGWGLAIVQHVARDWGIGPGPGRIWCELGAPAPPA